MLAEGVEWILLPDSTSWERWSVTCSGPWRSIFNCLAIELVSCAARTLRPDDQFAIECFYECFAIHKEVTVITDNTHVLRLDKWLPVNSREREREREVDAWAHLLLV